MKTVIAAVDFTRGSLNAARYAVDLASAINAEVLLVNVVQLPISVSEIPVSAHSWDQMIDESEDELKKLRDELAQRVNRKVKIDTKVPVGPVSYMLQQEAKERNAFAVITGTDSATSLQHLFLENHALSAVHRFSVPVVVVPTEASFKEIRRIVLAADLGRTEKASSLQILGEWINVFKAKLDIVDVVRKNQGDVTRVEGMVAIPKELRAFDPQLHLLYEDTVKEGIDHYIEQRQPDLLVVMPGNYGFIGGLFHMSTSKQLIRHPVVPVLSILD